MFQKLIVLVSLVVFFVTSAVHMADPPDFVQIVRSNGYRAESHQVVTRDGYKLRFYRMTGSALSSLAPGKRVVVLQHGFLCSSDFFVFMNSSDSLSYLLCDAGYDVWVTNIRGNTHGRSHVKLSPENPTFWDFSLQEMATIDLPTMIDYILFKTNKPHLTYIGHSMGNTLGFILLSELPQYNKKINYMISLAPVIFFHHSGFDDQARSNLKNLVKTTQAIARVHHFSVEIFSQFSAIVQWEKHICRGILSEMCAHFMNEWSITSGTKLTKREINTLSQYAPAGTSLKVLEHYRQIINDGAFKQFDYGHEKNMRIYCSSHPPQYNIRSVSTRVSLIWVKNDIFASELDIQVLAQMLPNLVGSEPVPSQIFHHADFLLFKGGRKLIQERILQLIQSNQ